ncbi:MAG: molybdenum cofactor guanylyltransferase [Desulfobacteraceae bacterium]|nr:MAG: molybdenum cofactor guanylyltransferase [Desulfobacteraceae bacterium]
MKAYPCTGVILAGGLNKRFSGKEKSFIEVDGKRIIDRLYDLFCTLFDEIIIVSNSPDRYLEWDALIVTDLFDNRSALTGIHAGLYYSAFSHAFFSASDTPFLKKDLIETIVDRIEPKLDVIVPQTLSGFEPLCAVYSKKTLPVVEKNIKENRFKIQSLFSVAHVERVPESQLRRVDPELASFININTPEDLQRALKGKKKEP